MHISKLFETTQIKNIFKQYYDLFFLSIYFFSLPIAHINAIQSISSGLFVLFFLLFNYKNIQYKSFLRFKKLIFVLGVILFLAIISLYYTPDLWSSIKEIKGELIRNYITMVIFFYYIVIIDNKRIKKIIFIIFIILLFHTFINIYIWYSHGMWPFRAGGLLDSGGGERFGIWATYALSASIALFFSKYKKGTFLLLFLSIISIIANQTRATFLATGFITIVFFIFFKKDKKIKLLILIFSVFGVILFYNYSKFLPARYNIHHIASNIKFIVNTPPSKFKKIDIEFSSLARLSMWKSVVLYRLKNPFVPTEFGRFLYGESIKINFKNYPKNLPFVIFAQTHNDFLGIWYALGTFGLVAFIYIFYYNLKISYKITDNYNNLYFKIYGVFTFLGTIGFMVSMIFGSFFGGSEAKLFYSLYGILLGIYFKESSNEKNILNKS